MFGRKKRTIEILRLRLDEREREIASYKHEIRILNDKLCAKNCVATDADVGNALRVAIVGKTNMLVSMRNGEWNVSMNEFKSATAEEVELLVTTYKLFKSCADDKTA